MLNLRFFASKGMLYASLIITLVFILSGCTASNSLKSDETDNPLGVDLTDGTTDGTSDGGTSLYDDSSGTSATAGGGLTDDGTGNRNPVITIKTSKELVGVGEDVAFTAEAIDPDGDLVTVSWNASAGVYLKQTTSAATWRAPTQSGEYDISCLAEDRKGGRAMAKLKIGVMGGRVYILDMKLSRYSLAAENLLSTTDSEWVPIPNAKVSFPTLGEVLISDDSGQISLDLDNKAKAATGSEVIVSYLGMEVKYQAIFATAGISQIDELKFHPGYDGISIAVGRGDSFTSKRGGVEVKTLQDINGQVKALEQVMVEVGSTQQLAKDGTAFLSLPSSSSELFVKLSKSGYTSWEGLKIPVVLDGVTLVMAQLVPTGSMSKSEATVSYTKPFNGQKTVSVVGPFEIGFSQGMEPGTVFDDFEMTVQDADGKSGVVVKGYDMRNYFSIKWLSPTTLQLSPKEPFKPLKRYALHVTRWNARTADGRYLKNYSSMFGGFTTDSDASPKMLATNPKNGDTEIPRSGPFEITFDQAMDINSLVPNIYLEITNMNTSAKVVIDSTSFAANFSVNWTNNDTKMALVPKTILKAKTPYQVRLVRTGLQSRTGKPVENLANLWGQFTTGDL
jgi:hypothetical protein